MPPKKVTETPGSFRRLDGSFGVRFLNCHYQTVDISRTCIAQVVDIEGWRTGYLILKKCELIISFDLLEKSILSDISLEPNKYYNKRTLEGK